MDRRALVTVVTQSIGQGFSCLTKTSLLTEKESLFLLKERLRERFL